MMKNREIKFRVWNGKEMIYPSIIGIAPYENFAWPHSRSYIHNCEDWDFTEGLIQEPILMQYTGLKDKHGVEIYEGDSLKDDDGGFVYNNVKLGEVVLGVDEFNVKYSAICFHAQCNDLSGYFALSQFDTKDKYGIGTNQCEVIGNTFDNPELIK